MTMRILPIAGLALLALSGCRPKDRDFIIYEGPSFHAAHTHPPKPELALEAKNGARLEVEKKTVAGAVRFREEGLSLRP